MSETTAGPEGPGTARRRAPTIDLTATEIPAGPGGPQPAGAEPKAGSGPDAESAPSGETAATRLKQSIIVGAAAGAAAALGIVAIILVTGILRGPGADTAARLNRLGEEVRALAVRPAPSAVDRKVVDELADRIARAEAQRAAAATADPAMQKTIEDLAQRLARVETTLSGAPAATSATDPALTARLGGVENSLRAIEQSQTRIDAALRSGAAERAELRAQVGQAALNAQDPSLRAADRERSERAQQAALDPIARRLVAVEQGLKSQADDFARRIAAAEQAIRANADEAVRRNAEGDTARAVRFAAAAALLQMAVERGEPYAANLDALRAQGADAKSVEPLVPFAGTGVPTSAALGRDLAALLPALRQKRAESPAAAGTDSGLFERLQNGLSRLVRVRPVGEPPSGKASDLSDIEARLSRGDVAGAAAALGNLGAAERAPAEPWLARHSARKAAVDAAQTLSAEAFSALGKPGR